jgi:hypothetical protein
LKESKTDRKSRLEELVDDNRDQFDEENDIDMEKDKTPIENVDEEIIKRYNLDTYDDEDDGKHRTLVYSGITSIFLTYSMISLLLVLPGLTGAANMYHKPGEVDPYLTGDPLDDELEDLDDIAIKPTDALLLAASTDVCT